MKYISDNEIPVKQEEEHLFCLLAGKFQWIFI